MVAGLGGGGVEAGRWGRGGCADGGVGGSCEGGGGGYGEAPVRGYIVSFLVRLGVFVGLNLRLTTLFALSTQPLGTSPPSMPSASSLPVVPILRISGLANTFLYHRKLLSVPVPRFPRIPPIPPEMQSL